jgi:hypothetical protein
MPIYLARASLPTEMELGVATDVAHHGLRVVTGRYWCRGESLLISPVSKEFQIQAKVAYCWKRLEHSCCLGLSLLDPAPRWWEAFQRSRDHDRND